MNFMTCSHFGSSINNMIINIFLSNRVCAGDVMKFSNPKLKSYCLQLSSSIASFVWKPAHFEFRSYGGAWHNAKIAFVEKYTLIS